MDLSLIFSGETGAVTTEDGISFTLASDKDDCGVILYDRKSHKRIKKVSFSASDRIGHLYSYKEEGIRISDVSYQFYAGNRIILDSKSKGFDRSFRYGIKRDEKELRSVIPAFDFCWGNDCVLRTPYENSFYYLLHTRGFTRHSSSGCKNPGTFLGILEKIEHFHKMGVTGVELQPVIDFDENEPLSVGSSDSDCRLNYWGYKKGFYYAPKASYCATEDSYTEFCSLVKGLHDAGLEIILQMYFPGDFSVEEMLKILRYWHVVYHVDGFHLIGENIPVSLCREDAILSDCKLFAPQISEYDYPNITASMKLHQAYYRDDYYYTMRRMLRGDDYSTADALSLMRRNPWQGGQINYLTSYWGFTLMDSVSYESKHNEENGEHNCDGCDTNFSVNCGQEGSSRRKKVRELRIQRIQNALLMLFFSNGTPLLFMGDEFGNSQLGNNNPYCIDGPVTWLNWKDCDKNSDIFEFLCQLSLFRRTHDILRTPKELTLFDAKALGVPDISYHSQNAWMAPVESYMHWGGIAYCEAYGSECKERVIYLAFNFSAEEKTIAVPRFSKEDQWTFLFGTGQKADMKDDYLSLLPFSVMVYSCDTVLKK